MWFVEKTPESIQGWFELYFKDYLGFVQCCSKSTQHIVCLRIILRFGVGLHFVFALFGVGLKLLSVWLKDYSGLV